MVGRQLALEDIVDLEDEALAETGNIILNSWVATIANLLKSALKMSLPIVIRGDGKRMFESATSTLVLFLHIKFEIHQKQIGGYVALLMDIPSIDELRSLIAGFVESLTQDENTGRRRASREWTRFVCAKIGRSMTAHCAPNLRCDFPPARFHERYNFSNSKKPSKTLCFQGLVVWLRG